MGRDMFGVVLWSDLDDRKAVIWCEDHGDLAFCNQPENEASIQLDAGDWVQFDLTMKSNMRFANNPRLIAEGVCDGLAEAVQGEIRPALETTQPTRGSAQIIALDAHAKRVSATKASGTYVGHA